MKNVEENDDGFRMNFDKTLPHQIPRGHRPHRSGAGIHEDKRRKRVRGNKSKRYWLENSDD